MDGLERWVLGEDFKSVATSARAGASSANLVTEYPLSSGMASRPKTLDTNTIRPLQPDLRMSRQSRPRSLMPIPTRASR